MAKRQRVVKLDLGLVRKGVRNGIEFSLQPVDDAVTWARFGMMQEWLSSIVTRRRGRLEDYLKQLRAYLDLNVPFHQLTAEQRENYLTAFYEANELRELHSAFEGKSVLGLRSKLNEIVSGPNAYTNEKRSGSNHPRNIALEVVLGARLMQNDVTVDYSKSADCLAFISGQPVSFQCKRPMTERSVEKNVKKAIKQLSVDCDPTLSSRKARYGIVVIDITKITNPAFNLLVASDLETMISEHAGKFRKFRLNHLEDRYGQEQPFILGFVMRLSSVATIPGGGAISIHHFVTHSLVRNDPVAEEVMEATKLALKN